MKFFDREKEIALLREIRGRGRDVAHGMKDGGECQRMSCFVLFDGCGESVL